MLIITLDVRFYLFCASASNFGRNYKVWRYLTSISKTDGDRLGSKSSLSVVYIMPIKPWAIKKAANNSYVGFDFTLSLLHLFHATCTTSLDRDISRMNGNYQDFCNLRV